MSAFHALNVESDNESEDEVDNTKEIQIEETLKLYQTALKYHSEGPQSFEKADAAYKALFDSEIFGYPEALSEYRRHELYGENLEFDSILQDDFEAGPVQLTGGNESAPNTLPQILHLAYKNRGQLVLQMVQNKFRHHRQLSQEEGLPHVKVALTSFAEALDKDDADLDLWSRAASVAALLGSRRLTRFCLEAVLDGEDELIDSILQLPGLEEGFAGQQLRELVSKLEDDLSLIQAPLSSMRRKKLSEVLKRRLNPYPFAPLPSEVSGRGVAASEPTQPSQPIVLNPAPWDWAGVGEVILNQYLGEQNGFLEPPPGSKITINIPADMPDDEQSPHNEAQSADDTNAVSGETDATSKKDSEDVVMEEADKGSQTKKEKSASATPLESSAGPQSRKRSTDSAGLPETAEGGRGRSKRIRARETISEPHTGPDTAAQELAKQIEIQLAPLIAADQYLYEIVNDIFAKLDVEGLGSSGQLRAVLTKGNSGASFTENLVTKTAQDMYAAIQAGGSQIASVLLGGEIMDLGGMSREAGLNAFLGYAKSGISQGSAKPTLGRERLKQFASDINSRWMSIKEVAFDWVESLLSPGSILSSARISQGSRSSYMQYRWPEPLKRHVVQVIVNLDEFLFEQYLERVTQLNSRILEAETLGEEYKLSDPDASLIDTVETLFELHLDVYSLIKHPHSGVDALTQTIQHDRLERWASTARDVMQLRATSTSAIGFDELALRHIWASVFHLSVTEDVEPEHVAYAMEELKIIFQSNDGPTIEVQNNAVMPELSVAAVDRELARINMKDFFLRVFDQDEKDPVAVIESLEPILEPAQAVGSAPEAESYAPEDLRSRSSSTMTGHSAGGQTDDTRVSRRSPFQEMTKFLDTASVSLRLSLWQRLREAYEAIEYPPKVVSCYLRSIETLMEEFKSPSYIDTPASEKYVKILNRLRIIDEVVVKILAILRTEKTAFDCLSYEHLQSSMSALSELLQIMSASNIYEDMLRVGLATAPTFDGCPVGTFVSIQGRLHDMQIRAWLLQYHLLKEGMAQNSKAFPTPAEDLFEYLRHVHYATGVRGFCHAAGRMFLRCAKDEIVRLDDVTDGNVRDTELSQVLYDLYELKTFTKSIDCQEFGATPEPLDKKTAIQLLPFILQQARKVGMKDLPKTELKVTIDKVHGALGRPRQNEDVTTNRKVVTAYCKSPINPMSLLKCVKGVGALTTKHIPPQSAVAAAYGWYFLMGNIALNKFLSKSRVVPGPTEDINFAQAFFLQDLEFSVDRWETWYRMAQTYDTQLEEAVSWTAEKLNNNISMELIYLQRSSIKCYTMAVACAVRDADESPQTTSRVTEMYTDFGNRIYSSSREPFSMHAFTVRDSEHKFYSGHATQQVYQSIPFSPMTAYLAWKFASVLFKRAISGNPDKWWNYYMLGKCLWKMHRTEREATANSMGQERASFQKNPPSWEDVVDAFVSAIETLPGKKEKRDPVLEPHYKLVSIVHKLVQFKEIGHEKGEEILQNTSYSANIGGPENADDWERYVLAVLKSLRGADKSGWHHRMTSRAAHTIYDEAPNDTFVAQAAKLELSQQIFTKTMAVQVWKPEHERAGRHFVYTTRYTRFFIKLLVQLNDRINLEALAKRVRKRPHEFFEHSKLWGELCLAYLKLLRRAGKIPEGHEDAVFKSLSSEEFQARAALLEAWCHAPTSQHPVLDVLREVIELKRLNNGLMKALLIDDLIGDTYAMLYAAVGPTLEPAKDQNPSQQAGGMPMSVTSVMNMHVDGSSDGSLISFPNAGHSDFQTARPRAKGVGRREIQRKAEAAVARPAIPILPSSTTIPIRSPPAATHLQLPPSVREQGVPETSPLLSRLNQLQVPQSGPTTAPGSVTNAESSVPGSMHDSADDESELSELDDQEVQEMAEASDLHEHIADTVAAKPMFPNLANKLKAQSQADASAATSSAASPEAQASD
jgi:hypothetical protein